MEPHPKNLPTPKLLANFSHLLHLGFLQTHQICFLHSDKCTSNSNLEASYRIDVHQMGNGTEWQIYLKPSLLTFSSVFGLTVKSFNQI